MWIAKIRMGRREKERKAYEGDFHVETFDERFVLLVQQAMVFIGQAFFDCSGKM